MPVIYQPSGRAREYSEWAVNVYSGCSHACVYCYVPRTLKITPAKFHCPKPRNGILAGILKDLPKIPWGQEVEMCFTCDPYQPLEKTAMITRNAIAAIKRSGHQVRVLTKGTDLAQRDFDLLDKRDWFGVTLTCQDYAESMKWEPGASLPSERIKNLEAAHKAGLQTWVSLEPVLDPDWTYALIKRTAGLVTRYKVGRLNYHPAAAFIDWRRFAVRVSELLNKLGQQFDLKEDLAKLLK